MTSFMARNQFSKILPYFLIISSYVFGIICIQFAVWPQLVNLTWFQMMLSCGLILYTYPQTNKNSILIFFIVSYFVGFIVEIIGVQSGLLFGTYYYGEVLGWKILDTPIVIGINWFLVTYAVNQLVDFLKLNKLGHSFVAASAITALDYLIEPDAIKLGMW
ncbi:MAG TPA: carotenoid biosynthesis protein, partial [Saprospiraceae bacterium]|nr:carotenoid biosynthesis protein [Saprospiraceae bacterium]